MTQFLLCKAKTFSNPKDLSHNSLYLQSANILSFFFNKSELLNQRSREIFIKGDGWEWKPGDEGSDRKAVGIKTTTYVASSSFP